MTTFNPGDQVTRDKYSGIFNVIHIDGKWAWIRKDDLGPHGSGYLTPVTELTKYHPPKPKWKPGRIYRNKASGGRIRVHAVGEVGAVGFRINEYGNSKAPWVSHSAEQAVMWEEVPLTEGIIGHTITWTIP